MSPPSPRPSQPNSASYNPARRTMYGPSQSARHTQYSALGNALGSGSTRQPQYSSDNPPPPSNVADETATQHSFIASDGRNYYTPSGLPSYEYPYQPASYETSTQYSHSSLPPMRTASPASHTPLNHSSSHYNPSAAPYGSSYSQVQYAPIPSSSQQWAEDDWGQPPQSFSPDHIQPVFVAARGDLATPQNDSRAYVAPQYSSTPVVRPDERGTYSAEVSPSSKGKTRERGSVSSDLSPSSAFGSASTNYSKARFLGLHAYYCLLTWLVQLMSTYSELLSECTFANTIPGKYVSLDDIERMLRSATQGLQLLQPPVSPVVPQQRNPSEDSNISNGIENQSPDIPTERQVSLYLPLIQIEAN
ncbi:hypothetical protein EW145_g2833 [Phellinidium pouzarii]|uniref:Uncharacterized protein n=1 Tax=Phellinidium pouzarii TaxID=167371 RepID=A0A4S4L9M8_9AGAM|nr:hypothetical protein EW145_g2833 [Phellinidium pouzarii]